MPLDMPFAPATFDMDARTVEAVIATTAPVTRRDARGPFAEVLDLDTLDTATLDGLPVLDSHRQGSVRDTIGRVAAIRREGDKLIASLKLSGADDVLPVLQRIGDGTLTGASIGYRVTAWRETQDAGRRTRKPTTWSLTEVTLTSNPADPSARLRHEGVTQMSDDVIETRPDEEERTRRSEIRTLVRAAGLETTVADDLIDAGADVTRAKAEVFDAMQEKRRSAPIIRSHTPANDDPAVINRRQSDAVAYRMAGGELVEDARPYVNATMRDLATESLQRAGVSTRGMSADDIFQRAAHTTSDFALVVSNAMGKVALDSYQAAESPLKTLCRQRTLPNFKPSTAIRLGEMGRLEPIAEDGEITHTSRGEHGESMRLKTFARGITVSRQLLIDDDLGMMGDMTAAMGEAAAQTEADELVTLLIGNPNMSDGTPVFDASRGNVHDVADPFSTVGQGEAAIAATRKSMRQRTGLDGRTLINVSPRFLLVGPELEDEAEKALAEIYPATSADVNTMAGKLSLLVEPRITDRTGFVFADPARLAAMQYAYLSSAQGVQIQRTESWDTLGMKFRAFLDFGAGWLDWRGAQMIEG